MRIKFKKGKQKWLLDSAICKAGSERKLGKILNIPYQSINFWRSEKKNLSDKTFRILLQYLNLEEAYVERDIESRLNENWGRKKGGDNLIMKHKENGTYESYVIYLRKRGSNIFSNWHKKMKEEYPVEYYRTQHERFKRIGLHKYKTIRGEYVRNELEMKTANLLLNLSLDYEYEPYILANEKSYFPDFKIGNLIIECTAWNGYLKVGKIRKRIQDFENEGFNVIIVIIPKIKKFYKEFGEKVIFDIDQASVAQTIRLLVK